MRILIFHTGILSEEMYNTIFKLTDREKRTYRCVYCEAENQGEVIRW